MRNILLLFSIFAIICNSGYSQQIHEEREWVDSVFASLSAEERIAQLMVVRANQPGEDYFNVIDKYISDYNIGGVCFFRNHPTHQLRTTDRWQSMAKTPLLVSIDAEWGLGMRLDSTTVFPFQMTLGAIQDNGLIYETGATIAEQCRRMGIHMNFAPVVDINSNPANPVIGVRSFGQDRENVMLKGMAYMQGLQDRGVIATAKHFPGHGDTDTDSHKTLPVVPHDAARLDSMELYPFRHMINNGLGGIMIAHLYIPEYEKEEGVASTLSAPIVSGLLREKLGFDGLIVTDALDMKGVTRFHKPGDIELMALMAGSDILLLPADVPRAIKRIKQAVDNGELDMAVVNERCRKVLAYKYRAGLNSYSSRDTDHLIEDLNSSRAGALNRILHEQAVTLVKNDNNILPLKELDTLDIAYVSPGSTPGHDLFLSTLQLYGRVKAYDFPGKGKKKELEELLGKLEGHNLVVIGIQNTSIYAFEDYGISGEIWAFVRDVSKRQKVVLDVFASPYSLESLGTGELPAAILVSYQDDPLSQQVSAEAIFGGIPVKGKLPVAAGQLYAAGHGIETEAIRFQFVDPATLGIADPFIMKADSIARSGIEIKAYPGCQVLAAKDGRIFYHKSFGYHTYDKKQAVELTDLYDLASLTKILATTLAVMDMTAEGSIDVDLPLSYYLPCLRTTDKRHIIIREMLAHQARFRAWIPYFRHTISEDSPDTVIYSAAISEDYPVRVAEGMYIHRDYYHAIIDSIRYSKLRDDEYYRYSDLGFYLLKEAIEGIENMAFEKLLEERYYAPLGLPAMGFLPLKRYDKNKIAPTEDDKVFRHQVLRGDVHDQGAAMLGGVSGHAGLFANAMDVGVIMQLFLDGGVYGGDRYIEEEVIEEFTRTQFPLNLNRKGIGFDKPMLEYEDNGPACRSASQESFGHSGFTGTYAWADPENGLVYVFLSNRVHPDANNNRIMEYDIRTNLHQVFYDAIEKSGSH